MTPNVELMRNAKASLKGNWGNAALTTLVMALILGASASILIRPALLAGPVLLAGSPMVDYIFFLRSTPMLIGPILLAGPLMVGYISFLRAVCDKNGETRLEILFNGFNDFWRSFLAYLIMSIFIFLWSLLLLIPGIIMAFAYSMTMFIIQDDKDISAREAVRKSRDMMRGHKWELFCLWLRFIGWIILVILTLGIASFWVEPYMQMATLNFYNDVKADYERRQSVTV